jgi:hypothetical protein
VSYCYEETFAKNYVFMMRELAMMIVEVSVSSSSKFKFLMIIDLK